MSRSLLRIVPLGRSVMLFFIFPAKIFAVSGNNRTFAKGIAHCGYGAHNTHISYGKERKTNRWAYWSNWPEKDYKPQELRIIVLVNFNF